MSDTNILVLSADGTLKKIDNELIGDILRQRIEIGGASLAEIVKVISSTPGGSDYGLVTRNIPSGTQPVSAASLPLPTDAATETSLAAAAASLSVIDDWDETDRAKVNPIAGQAGVQGASGAVTALTQRVVLATDIALPTGSNAIGKLAANSGVDIGDVDVTSVPADPFGANADAASATGSVSAKLRYLAATGIAGMTTLPAGTNNIGDVDVLTLPNVTLAAGTNTNEVVGDVAHDDVSAGNPVLVGGYASAAAPSDVSADADVTRAWFLRNGAAATAITAAGALIGGDAANGLDVDVTRLPALATGANTIGEVIPAPKTKLIQVVPTISTSPAYTSGDVIGGLQTLANAARVSGGSGIIQSILVLDNTQAQRAAMDLLFFDRSVSVASDNAAVAMSDGDMAFCLGVIPIGPYNAAWPGTPLNSIATLLNIGLPYVLNGTSLFVVAVVRGTPTYVATTDLTFTYVLLQD